MNALRAGIMLTLVASLAAAQLPDWDFTTGEDYGWSPNKSLRTPELTDEGLVTALESTDPWMIGPPISVAAEDARYVHVRLRVAHHGGGSVYFTTDTSPQFKQDNMVKFRVAPGGEWQDLLLDPPSPRPH